MKLGQLLSRHKPADKNEIIKIYDIDSLELLEELNPTDRSKYEDCNIDRFYCLNGVINVEIYISNLENGDEE